MTRHKVREKDFTRNRSLPFSYIVVCLISLIKSTLQHELDEFFKNLFRREFSDQQVTDSAFCQARRKIKPTAFIELSQQVVSHFYQEADYKKWKGHRLVGIDGCKINLPYSDSIAENFHPQTKSTKAGKTIYMANVSQAFDLLNHMVLDASISSTKGEEGSEFRQALHHIHKLQPGDVILADRGYPGFIMFSAILSQGLDFCMRLPKSSFKQANDFMQSKAKEAIVTIAIRDKKVKAKCKRLGYPTDEIQVRLVKVKLPTGDTEILATSLLDTKVYSRSVFKSLYALRWNVEEAYKRLKHRLHIENFSGKSYLAGLLRQVIHCQSYQCNDLPV